MYIGNLTEKYQKGGAVRYSKKPPTVPGLQPETSQSASQPTRTPEASVSGVLFFEPAFCYSHDRQPADSPTRSRMIWASYVRAAQRGNR